MTPLEQKALANIQALRTHLLNFTARLVAMDEDGDIIGISSGFIVRRASAYVLLAAGHALKTKSWFLETNVSLDDRNETVGIQLTGVYNLKTVALERKEFAGLGEDVDFAFVILPESELRKQMQSEDKLRDPTIELLSYNCPLGDEPIRESEPYSYASWNQVTYYRAFKSFVEREATSEFMMVFKGMRDDGALYEFELSRQHQGEKYYKGASGSPIVDPEGKVVSMLIGGDPARNVLYGLPLSRFVRAIDVALQHKNAS